MAIDRRFYLRCEQNFIIMYSSEDLERFYFQYQTEALPHGEVFHPYSVRFDASTLLQYFGKFLPKN